PEGTRSPDGSMREFKATLGQIALSSQVDILPIWLEGAHSALPKGAAVLRGRKLKARIGPTLTAEQLRVQTQGLSPREAARKVTELAQEAVKALRRGRVLDLSQTPVPEQAPSNAAHAHHHAGSHTESGQASNGAHAVNGGHARNGHVHAPTGV